MTLVLTENDVRKVLTMPIAIEAVERAFGAMNDGSFLLHSRRRFRAPGGGVLNYMAAADMSGGYEGLKIYTYAKGVVRFIVPLYRCDTGELAALIEAGFLSRMRTGAATGVATKFMARRDTGTVGMIGTGSHAPQQIEAVCAVRHVKRIRVFSRNEEKRQAFARAMSDRLRVPVEPTDSAEAAVREADVVITMTNSVRPVMEAAWLAPGVHINAAGSNVAQKSEIDAETVHRADVIATDSLEQAKKESGDLIQAFGEHAGGWSRVCELAHVVSGKTAGRHNAQEMTLFKSNGVAIEDIAVAARVYELALERGIGRELPLFEEM